MNKLQNSNENLQISVIIPLYNEEKELENFKNQLIPVLNNLNISWELILVDDGSKDNSLSLITQLAETDNRIKIISYKNNKGRGYALKAGFKQSKGKYVITTEFDLSYGTAIIKDLYEELTKTNKDIVIASPYRKGGKLENVPVRRAFLSWLGNKILHFTVSEEITTLTGMTRGYIGNKIRSLFLEEDGKEIHLEIISKAIMMKFSFHEIPATLKWSFSRRDKITSKHDKFKANRLIQSHLLFGFNESPILLFGFFGITVLLSGVFIGIYLTILFFIFDEVIGDRIILIMSSVFFILSGLQIFLFCFLSYQNKYIKGETYKNLVISNNIYDILNKK